VINVDVTYETEQHVHRIGRTGRAGEEGLALNLASLDEMGRVGNIEVLQGAATTWHHLDELDTASDKPLVAPMVTLQILGGRKEKIRPGDVLGALTKDMGFPGTQIGKINVTEMSTYVAVERAIADKVLGKLNAGFVKGKRVRARRIEGIVE
jgi:ATP-independent RNA helicase DbpA